MGSAIHTFTDGFSTSTHDDWLAIVEAGLKGRNFETVLVRRTDDGIVRGPLFTAESLNETPKARARAAVSHLEGRDWHIAAPVRDSDITYANAQALRDLKGGASALRLSLDTRGETGTAIRTVNSFKRLFEGIHTDLIPITLAPGKNAGFAALFAARDEWHDLSLSLGMAPIADGLLCGETPDLGSAMKAAVWASKHAPNTRAITINAAAIHEAGGSEAQELAFIASAAATYMRALLIAGLSAESAAGQIAIELAADQDGHLGIAKIRAARQIFARIMESFGVTEQHRTVPIHAITSLRMMTKIDPWTNMLRVMAAGFGAVCGGADYVTTRPFTDALTSDGMGLATPFGHRTARNMQLLMQEESHLGQVFDPANGSYFHEHMTSALAQEGWAIFQSIESKGGIETTDAQTYLAGKMRKAHRKRLALIAKQIKPILGVSLYPAAKTRPAEIRRAPVFTKGSTAPLMAAIGFSNMISEAKQGLALPVAARAKHRVLPPVRLSEPVEILSTIAPEEPVLLIALSHDPMANARMTFIENYLKGAGISATILRPQTVLYPLQDALKRAENNLVFFAGTDADYAGVGKKVASALKTARACKIWVCAKPNVAAKTDYAYGPLYNGQDRIATLSEVLGLMGVELDG